MTRRRTIGENPLDSITVPARSTPREEKHRAPRREKPMATVETKTESKESASADSTQKPASRCQRVAHVFDGSRIHILGGDVAPCHTRLTVPYLGEARGFRLADNEFVTIKRDVVRLTVTSAETVRRTGKLLLWSTVGAFLAGPLGALAGSLYGGWARHMTYVEMMLKDGRKIVAATSPATIEEIQSEIG